MAIPFYGIKKFYEENSNEILDTVNRVYSLGMMFGEETVKLENELCKLTGRKFAITVNSCTDALFFALKSAGVGKGNEVIVTSFSFIASSSPIVRVGAIPVFADINPSTYLTDISDLEKKITTKTKAIIAVHLFGQTLDISAIETIAKKNNIFLIEDAAQALGAKSAGRKAGSMGNTSCLSFDPTKILSAFGSGGALLTDDEQIYKIINKLRYHGKGSVDDYELPGFNSRLSASQCALLTYQMNKHLTKRINRLREIAQIYQHELSDIDELTLPEVLEGNLHIFHKYVIQTPCRDKLRTFMKDHGIETMVHYSKPSFKYSLFLNFSHKAENITVCDNVCNNVLSIPIYPELKEEEIYYICKTIKSF
jgi:UDP-2-acetamido-2-deoxy-ribo-hexuluronate aminotransferase